MDGPAPLRHLVGSEEMVTIDSGPSWLHVVSDTASRHVEIAPSVDAITKELRRLQRHLDHQHRRGSPQCFDEKGRHIQGYCHWKNRSKPAKETQAKIVNLYRIMAARRDTDHGTVANALVAISRNIRTEDHGMKAWQRGFWSKSVQRRGPGGQLARIERAVIRAGGTYDEIESKLALSQTCICGARIKKPLNQRRHRCENCGLDLDRDLFSAFLMYHVRNKNGHQELDLDAARAELFGTALASTTWEREGVLATLPLKRQDIGAAPDETLSEQEKRQVQHRHLPGRRSLVRIRKRHKAKAKVVSDRAVRSEDGVTKVPTTVDTLANQPSPTAKVA